MPQTYAQLTTAQQTTVQKQEAERLLQECASLYPLFPIDYLPAFIAGSPVETAYADLADKCRRGNLGWLYFVVAVGRTTAIRNHILATATARVTPLLYSSPDEVVRGPVAGEDAGA